MIDNNLQSFVKNYVSDFDENLEVTTIDKRIEELTTNIMKKIIAAGDVRDRIMPDAKILEVSYLIIEDLDRKNGGSTADEIKALSETQKKTLNVAYKYLAKNLPNFPESDVKELTVLYGVKHIEDVQDQNETESILKQLESGLAQLMQMRLQYLGNSDFLDHIDTQMVLIQAKIIELKYA